MRVQKRVLTFLCVFLSLILLAACSHRNPAADTAQIRARVSEQGTSVLIATYNTAAPWGSFFEGTSSSKRAPLFAQQMAAIAPDSFGVQEINSDWVNKMETLLPDYAYYGVQRGGDSKEKTSEMSGIFYLKEKYELLESGTFWISETPDTESKFEGAGCNRVCSFVVLQNRATGLTYAHFNTHLDNVSEEARTLGGRLIAARAAELAQKYDKLPTVVTGDLNQYSDGTACQALEAADFVNASSFAAGGDSHATYHNWGEYTDGQPIDFIFLSAGLSATQYTIHSEQVDSTFVSDHYCVSARVDFA